MPLVRICTQCGSLNPEAKRECRRCGAPISAIAPVESSSLPEEVRQAGNVDPVQDLPGTPTPVPAWKPRDDDAAPPRVAAVVITGIEVPFLDLVILLVKLAIAAVPAVIVVALFWALVSGVLVGMLGGVR